MKLSGFLAWLMYSTVHLFYLTGVSDRIRVLFSWVWSFFTSARGARLITQPVTEQRALPTHLGPFPEGPPPEPQFHSPAAQLH
jgi:hypothetical protein